MSTTTLPRLARCAVLAAALLAPAAWAAFNVNAAKGTVTDDVANLEWDRCYVGQTTDGCTLHGHEPANATMDWEAALKTAKEANARNYKGHNDWRVPNVKELRSLVDKSLPAPADLGTVPSIDVTAFPGALPNVFWTSTTYASSPSDAWGVNFLGGNSGSGNQGNPYYVRLVRSGQSFAFFDSLADTTAPGITTPPGLTVTPGADGVSAQASVTLDEAATAFWQVLPAADPDPVPLALLALGAGQQVNLAANTAAGFPITGAGLTQGTAYKLHFIARDGAGNATAVQSVAFTTAGAPGAPTGVTAIPGAAGSGAVEVSWTAPADNGGSAITHYTVSPNPNSVACAASPCVITGLANAAQHSFTVTATNGVDTGAASTASDAVILQGTQTVTFNTQAPQSFAAGSFAINPVATASSGLTDITYASQTPGVCTVSGSTVTIVSVGACIIAASHAGSAYWAPAGAQTQSITIGQGAQVITFNPQAPQTFTAGGSFTLNPLASASSGLSVTYSSQTLGVCTISGSTVTMVSAGNCIIAANQAGGGNWSAAAQQTQTIAIGQGTQTITFGAQAPRTFTSGGSFTLNPLASATSGLAVTYTSQTTGVCTISGATVTMVSTGTCTIAADQPGDGNWHPAAQVTQSIAINAPAPAPSAQTITFGAQAPQTFVAGGSFGLNPLASATSGLPVTYSTQTPGVCTVSGSTVTMVSAGTCTIAANQPGNGNWSAAAQQTQNIAIGKGVQTITFGAQASQTFAAGGSFALNPLASATSGLAVAYSSLTPGVCTLSGATVTMVSAGTCTVAANQPGNGNWNPAAQVTQSVTITPTAPGVPTGVQATPLSGTQVRVRWTPPADTGGGPVTYTVTALVNGQPSGQGCTAVSPATECTVTGLTPGVAYTFHVQAGNGAGSSAASAPSSPVTPQAASGAGAAVAIPALGEWALALLAAALGLASLGAVRRRG